MPPKSKPTDRAAAKHESSQRKIRQKAAPKQPLSVADRLKRLFTSLCAQIDGGHFANAIKTCDKILRLEPSDHDALQTKLFLLLQTDQYAAALAMTLPKEDTQDVHDRAFEHSYSLYRLHREAEATTVLQKVKEKGVDEGADRGVLHLEAQLAYRQAKYDEAAELYNQLLDTAEPNSEEHSDILTNLEAAQKHLDFQTSGFLRALDTALPPTAAAALQTAPPPQQTQQQLASVSALADASNAPAPKEKAKKVRMKRVPNGVVPGVTPPPDPERWLKRSERTSFAQGRRRRGGGGATQGAMEPAGGNSGGKGSGGGGKGKRRK
ncbi:uncharacterized protein BXZ73DRAFT_49791 [Epithele typhae]|uniref:uncharacterized protein n=1 Tax=Epithele typhae TaxID=378194 RepID=UPI002007206C|nr:uncharacterized protein BXZ73DRAFT_49791 [Epithele typhae]KAH9925894.1 hypothetical protein BXZ73DRAFT_49791 [Epithele typhae]